MVQPVGRSAPASARPTVGPRRQSPVRADEGLDLGKISVRVLSAGIHHDNAMKSRRYARSAVWWRRRELNPGPKTFSTTDLHV